MSRLAVSLSSLTLLPPFLGMSWPLVVTGLEEVEAADIEARFTAQREVADLLVEQVKERLQKTRDGHSNACGVVCVCVWWMVGTCLGTPTHVRERERESPAIQHVTPVFLSHTHNKVEYADVVVLNKDELLHPSRRGLLQEVRCEGEEERIRWPARRGAWGWMEEEEKDGGINPP